MKSSLVMGSNRERSTVVLVAGLCAFYATFMLLSAGTLSTMARGLGNSGFTLMLNAVAAVFIGIALYVAAIVISGCVATVIAGRSRQIATLRLLGATPANLRSHVTRGCAASTGAGVLLGTLLGVLTMVAGRATLQNCGILPRMDYPLFTWAQIPASMGILITGMVAARIGSTRVLRVSPMAAMSDVPEQPRHRTSHGRAAAGALLVPAGAAMLALACLLGEKGSAAGLPAAFLGCAILFTGVLSGAPLFVPALVRAVSTLMGNAPSTRIARRNAVADPLRTTRSTLGLIIGVTLTTAFASGASALSTATHRWDLSASHREMVDRTLTMATAIMIGMVVIASVIAAVGFISTMSLVVIQRRREIGLLRAMGFTARQVTGMVATESLALGLTAVVFGSGLGIVFGSVGTQSLVGAMTPGFVWGLPLPVLAAILTGALVLVLVAAVPPARRATAVTTVEALRITA